MTRFGSASARPAGSAPAVGVWEAAVFSVEVLSSLPDSVTTTAPTATTTIAPTIDPAIVICLRLRSRAARRSSWRSSLRFAASRRC
ncbi:hypothetical protein P9209_20705 [Prescottella defluvii]|nr:hypothetical protein P9209_20705 [Prescottella defluvii]